MKVQVESEGGVVLFRPQGKLDALSAPQLQETLNAEAPDAESRIVIDMSEVPYVSSAGLRIFIRTAKQVSGSGKMAVGGLTSGVRQVFQLAGFDRIMSICDDVDSAKQSVQ